MNYNKYFQRAEKQLLAIDDEVFFDVAQSTLDELFTELESILDDRDNEIDDLNYTISSLQDELAEARETIERLQNE